MLSDRCIEHATGKCNFTCANGYKKTIDILECKKSGNWDHPINTVCESKNNIYIKKAPQKNVFILSIIDEFQFKKYVTNDQITQ